MPTNNAALTFAIFLNQAGWHHGMASVLFVCATKDLRMEKKEKTKLTFAGASAKCVSQRGYMHACTSSQSRQTAPAIYSSICHTKTRDRGLPPCHMLLQGDDKKKTMELKLGRCVCSCMVRPSAPRLLLPLLERRDPTRRFYWYVNHKARFLSKLV